MLQVKNISFRYNNDVVLKNISFSVKTGEHVSIIGESGSGKTTLLKLIYGEYDLIKGQIFWNNHEILGPKFNLVVGQSHIKYVAQEFDLMPYKTVEENVGEFLSNFYLNEKKARVTELLEAVELTTFSKAKVHSLSGGQKQRVALARAIAKQPEIILLDEPFSHIDNFKKQSLRRNLFSFLKSKNITCIVATHDKDDVLPYSDTVVVLNQGEIIANNSPEELFSNPDNPLIASFFGEYNIINGDIFYAHQLKIVDDSKLKATVKNSYFNGRNYLIEVIFNNESVFIEHSKSIKLNQIICFEISK
ncbi:MAG TPA: ABC transporter ATP-binding protein [Flavobacteriaceae bacterium]|nr:ABC transporter ATP-binding protein [Flavobacteriaceae bacterium]